MVFQVAYVPIGVGTFHLESAQEQFDRSVAMLRQLCGDCAVPDKMLLSVDALSAYLEVTPPDNREAVFESLDYLVMPPVIEDYALMSDIITQKLAAAAEGRGAALSGSLLAVEDLRAGRLHALRSPSIAVTSRYTAACPGEAADTPRVRAFFNWMREELERDMTEFPDCFPEADGS